MEDYTIVVNQIEDLQTTKDIQTLESIFEKAKRTIVGGNDIILVREDRNGARHQYNVISNEKDFINYREQVFKYL